MFELGFWCFRSIFLRSPCTNPHINVRKPASHRANYRISVMSAMTFTYATSVTCVVSVSLRLLVATTAAARRPRYVTHACVCETANVQEEIHQFWIGRKTTIQISMTTQVIINIIIRPICYQIWVMSEMRINPYVLSAATGICETPAKIPITGT